MQLQETLRERDELQQTIDDGNAKYEVYLPKTLLTSSQSIKYFHLPNPGTAIRSHHLS